MVVHMHVIVDHSAHGWHDLTEGMHVTLWFITQYSDIIVVFPIKCVRLRDNWCYMGEWPL